MRSMILHVTPPCTPSLRLLCTRFVPLFRRDRGVIRHGTAAMQDEISDRIISHYMSGRQSSISVPNLSVHDRTWQTGAGS